MVERVEALTDAQVHACMGGGRGEFGNRHRDIRGLFLDHFGLVEDRPGVGLSHFGMKDNSCWAPILPRVFDTGGGAF